MILGMAALLIVDAWIGWRWLEARASNRALTERLKTSEWLLDYYREQADEYAMYRENDAYIRATGGCNCDHLCSSCERELTEYHSSENELFYLNPES